MLLCKNLSISIWLEQIPDQDPLIRIRLVDKLAMKKIEITVEPSKKSAYHVQETVVIGMRRLVTEAIKQGLISVTLGPSSRLPLDTRRGGIKDIILSIDPDV